LITRDTEKGEKMSKGMELTTAITACKISAPTLTHGLKILGNGSMQEGIKRVGLLGAQFGYLKGVRRGRGEGVVVGFLAGVGLTTTTVLGAWEWQKQKSHREKYAVEETVKLGPSSARVDRKQDSSQEKATQQNEMEDQ
jgi:hypothetical protein